MCRVQILCLYKYFEHSYKQVLGTACVWGGGGGWGVREGGERASKGIYV